MTIENDREEDLSPDQDPPWPVRAVRFVEQRPRSFLASAAVILVLIASLATQLRPADPPSPRPAAVPSTAQLETIRLDLAGVAYHRTIATTGIDYDLMFSVTAPFPPAGGRRFTSLYRVDTASGTTFLRGQWPADQRDTQIFADPHGPYMLVASQFDLALSRLDREPVVAVGPKLNVVSVLFLGPANDRSSLIVASTPGSVVDITRPDHPRVVVNVGGTLLGRLDDGRFVLASLTPDELVVLAVGLDGSQTELARMAGARGPAALQRFPTPTSPFRVLALRDVDPGSRVGSRVVAAIDLSTGSVTDLQVLGREGTFAPETDRPGVYVFTQGGEDRIGGRGTQNIEVPLGRHAFLDPLRSWSPDFQLIAFGAQSASGNLGLTGLTRDGRLIADLLPVGTATVQLIGWVPRT